MLTTNLKFVSIIFMTKKWKNRRNLVFFIQIINHVLHYYQNKISYLMNSWQTMENIQKKIKFVFNFKRTRGGFFTLSVKPIITEIIAFELNRKLCFFEISSQASFFGNS